MNVVQRSQIVTLCFCTESDTVGEGAGPVSCVINCSISGRTSEFTFAVIVRSCTNASCVLQYQRKQSHFSPSGNKQPRWMGQRTEMVIVASWNLKLFWYIQIYATIEKLRKRAEFYGVCIRTLNDHWGPSNLIILK